MITFSTEWMRSERTQDRKISMTPWRYFHQLSRKGNGKFFEKWFLLLIEFCHLNHIEKPSQEMQFTIQLVFNCILNQIELFHEFSFNLNWKKFQQFLERRLKSFGFLKQLYSDLNGRLHVGSWKMQHISREKSCKQPIIR